MSKPFRCQAEISIGKVDMIRTTYLKINRPEHAACILSKGIAACSIAPLTEASTCAALYNEVGKSHYWDIYRIGWDITDWENYLAQPEIYIAAIHGADDEIGYLELNLVNKSLEIVNFGLRPNHIGKGLGKAALMAALHYCLSFKPSDIWLHTCNLDHPAALKTYYACGFQLMEEKSDNFLPLDPTPANTKVAATGLVQLAPT